jgi:DNA-binding NarL/FixJ family response regulator
MKTLIADDHEWFRREMRAYLEEQKGIEIVGEVCDGLEAVSFTKLLNPDLVILDISMPRMNGFEAARQIKEHSPSTKVLIVTIHESETYQVFAQMMNVDGYVCKSTLKNDLPKILATLSLM